MGMTNDLTTTNGGAVFTDAVVFAGLREAVRRFYASITREGGRDTLPHLPAPEARQRMQERRVALHLALRPISMATADQKRARDAVAALLGGYLNIRTDNPAAVAAGYTAHLGEQPLFAILQACDDFANHRVVDHIREDGTTVYFTMDHAPSAFRLLDQVKKCAADARTEHYQIGRVLAITKARGKPIMTAEEEQRVAESLRLHADSLLKRANAYAEIERKKIREESAAARDRAQRIIQEAAARRRAEMADQETHG